MTGKELVEKYCAIVQQLADLGANEEELNDFGDKWFNIVKKYIDIKTLSEMYMEMGLKGAEMEEDICSIC